MIPSWAKVGVKVVCVDADWIPTSGAAQGLVDALPVHGQVYTIRAVDSARRCLLLSEIRNNPEVWTDGWGEADFAFSHFRPLITATLESDIAIFRPLFIPAPELVE